VSTALDGLPDLDADAGSGIVARRAVIRWGWRLFRREWRQQLHVLRLLTVAVAAAIWGAGVVRNSQIPPGYPTFGGVWLGRVREAVRVVAGEYDRLRPEPPGRGHRLAAPSAVCDRGRSRGGDRPAGRDGASGRARMPRG
jgi:hypothetical protein